MTIYKSMNFPVYDEMQERYKDKADLISSYSKGGLNGLEIIMAGDRDENLITPDMVNGVHLFFHSFWMDFWLGNHDRLDKIFDSRQQWIEYYGGMEKEAYLKAIEKDLDYAHDIGAKYVVFHVSEVTPEETMTYKSIYSDDEVIEAALEVINSVLKDKPYTFDFLVENLWWAGFNLKNPEITKKLINGIEYPHKGILIDTGHAMNNNWDIKTPEEGVKYIHGLLDCHEREGVDITTWIKGMHLHMSLGGDCARRKAEEGCDYSATPFYEQFRLSYAHAREIDQHIPFIAEGIKELVERINPDYLTMEFQPDTREEYEEYIERQAKALGYI